MKTRIYLLIFSVALIVSACMQKEKNCILSGKVIRRPQSTELRLSKAFVDFRSQSAIIIPIKDSAFHYELNFKDTEAYVLVFEDEYMQGSMRPITFFTIDGTITMELNPIEEYQKNIITGGNLNQEFIEYQKKTMDESMGKMKPIFDSMEVLQATDNYDSQVMKDLLEKMRNTEKQEDKYKMYAQVNELYQSGEGLSSAAKQLEAHRDSINKILQEKEVDYLKENISIPSYYTLIRAILNTVNSPGIYDLDKLSAIQKEYAANYKDHPYTQYSNEILWRISNLKPGGDFFDFSLPDLAENEYTLSDEIKGKYAFIDIWAPWCGPCIAKSREMKAVYESYKEKGFTVVGVATKYEDLDDVVSRLEKDEYPWLTLIDKPELDSRINEHYGVEKAGGGTVLVDNKGKVVLVNPTIEEVQEVLESRLGED